MIPKIIHQVWIGEEPPKAYKDAMESVKRLHPNYKYILHGNEAVKKYNLEHLFNKVPHAFLSNIIRVKEVEKTGGWYIDADMIALQSIDNLSEKIHNSPISCLEMAHGFDKNHLTPQNGFFGIEKGYNLSKILDKYTGKTPSIAFWEHNLTEYTPISPELCSINGTILKDLLLNSWGKQYRELVDKRIL